VHGSNSVRLLAGLATSSGVAAALAWGLPLAGDTRTWTLIAASAGCSIFGFLLWTRALRMHRAMADVPTARLASAPQGYVELHGRARRLDQEFSTVRPHFLWQRVTRSTSGAWWVPAPLRGSHDSVEVTEVPFGFSDGKVTAVILPEGAEILCRNRQVEKRGRETTVTESIHSGEPLYVLGYLTSLDRVPDLAAQAERIAADIRLDPRERERFDADRDGYLGVPELLELHREAKDIALEQAVVQQTQTHVLAAPPDGRQYLISTLPIDRLSGRLLGYAWFGLACGLGGIASAVAGSTLVA
jgi:hypothetical protein